MNPITESKQRRLSTQCRMKSDATAAEVEPHLHFTRFRWAWVGGWVSGMVRVCVVNCRQLFYAVAIKAAAHPLTRTESNQRQPSI